MLRCGNLLRQGYITGFHYHGAVQRVKQHLVEKKQHHLTFLNTQNISQKLWFDDITLSQWTSDDLSNYFVTKLNRKLITLHVN